MHFQTEKLKKNKRLLGSLVFTIMIVLPFVVLFSIPQIHASPPLISPPIKVATNAFSTGAGFVHDNYGNLGQTIFSCFMNNVWYIVYPSATSPLAFRYSQSQDGVTWSTDVALFTTHNNINQKGWGTACLPNPNGNLGAGTLTIGYIDFGTTPFGFYNSFIFTNPTTFTKQYVNDAGVALPTGTMSGSPSLAYDSGGNFIFLGLRSTGNQIDVFFNGTYDHSITISGLANGDFIAIQNGAGTNGIGPLNNAFYFDGQTSNYVPNVVYARTLFPMSGTTTHNSGGQPTLLSTFAGGTAGTILYPYAQGTGTNNGHCSIETFNLVTAVFTNTVATGQSTVCGPASNFNYQQWAVSDGGGQNIWLLYGTQTTSINQFVYSSDNGNTFAVAPYSPSGTDTLGFSGIYTNQNTNQKQAIAVETDFTGNIWAQLFSNAVASGSNTTKQTLGSCALTALDSGATSTPTNATVYYYAGQIADAGSITNFTTKLASVFSFITPQTLMFGIYATNNAGPVSVSNPLNLIWTNSKSLQAGLVDSVVQWQPNIGVGSPTNEQAWIAFGIIGTNKMRIYQNTASLQLYSVAAPSSIFPATISQLTTNAGNYGMCITLLYTNFLTVTSTFTSTLTSTLTAGSTTLTVTTTSFIYSLQGSNGSVAIIQDVTTFLPFWIIPIVMGYAFGMIGLVFGFIIALFLGFMLGLLPIWTLFLVGIGLYILFKRG